MPVPSLSCDFERMRARYSAVLRLLAMAAFVSVASEAAAQAVFVPDFDVETTTRRVETPDGPQARLDVYTAVPNTSLRFLARQNGFAASYAVTVEVYTLDAAGQPEGLVVSRTFERDVTAPDYTATQDADTEDRAVQTLDVPPGRYVVEVAVEDGSSGRSFTQQLGHVVRAVGDGRVQLSDPLLLSAYDPEAGLSTPIVGGAVSTELDAFWIAYDIYSEAPAEVQVTYVVTEQNRVRERPSFQQLLGLAPREQADLGTPVAVSEGLSVEAGRTPAAFRIDAGDLEVGDYALTVRLETFEGLALAEAEKRFSVRWMGLDSQIADLDQAIEQLRYVAKEDEYQSIRRAGTPEQQAQMFLDFWRDRDPTPGTPRNEEMEQFYFRVAHANEHYGRFRNSGWNTDRGEVFIRFGEPDFVENHPFNYGTKPYQIWEYSRVGRRFIFVDDNGMGDFRLLVPIWDDRTRMR